MNKYVLIDENERRVVGSTHAMSWHSAVRTFDAAVPGWKEKGYMLYLQCGDQHAGG